MTHCITSWNTPYTFSGKEKDVETGYSYFGARYYNSDLSLWLSVDPMSDKYPSMSPYNYCANNPVILVDPDGREICDWIFNLITGKYEWNDYVTSKENTPICSRYVGPNDVDVLNDLGIYSGPFNKLTSKSKLLGMDGNTDNGTAAPILGLSELSVQFDVRPVIKYDKNKVTETNKSGKTFAGVEFTTTVSQNNATSDGSPTNYGGYLSLKTTTNNFSERINSSCGGYSVPGSSCASIFIPINQIKTGSIISARITLGNPNPNMIFGSKSFNKLYNLRTLNYESKNTIYPNFNIHN